MRFFVAIVFLGVLANGLTNDQMVSAPGTNEKVLFGATPSAIQNFFTNNPTYRLSTIKVQTVTPLTLMVTLVPNTGDFAVPGWWWYYGVTANQISGFLSTNTGRLIDIDSYNNGNSYVVIMVSNTGTSARGWYWWVGQSYADVVTRSSLARITRLNVYTDAAGARRYNIIQVVNTGADQTSWWWYTGVTPATLSTTLSTNNARLVSLQTTIDGTLHAVMVADTVAWWWWYGQTLTQTSNTINTINGRIIDLTPNRANPANYNIVLIGN